LFILASDIKHIKIDNIKSMEAAFLDSDDEDGALVTMEPTSSEVANRCWMCLFHGCAVNEAALKFICDSLPHITLDSCCEQLVPVLKKQAPDYADWFTKETLKEHIENHMAHPKAKLCGMIHGLDNLQRQIQSVCIVEDPNTKQKTINMVAIKTYLAIVREVQTLYRQREDFLLFGNRITMEKN
jgi:hypothetical protein